MRISGGVRNDVVVHSGPGDSLTIALSQAASSADVWTLTIEAEVSSIRVRLGSLTTRPPQAGDPPSRVVAIATCPGALRWWVVYEGPQGAKADLVAASSTYCTGAPGVTAIHHP